MKSPFFLQRQFWGYYLILAALIVTILLALELDALYRNVKALLNQ